MLSLIFWILFGIGIRFDEPVSNIALSGSISRICFSRDGTQVAFGGAQGELAIFSSDGWKKLAGFKPGSSRITDLDFSPDGLLLAYASQDKAIRIVNPSGEIVRKFDSDGWGMGVSFSPDGKQIVGVFADGVVRVWNVESGSQVWQKQPGGMRAVHLRWHPSKPRIAIADPSGWYALLDAKDGTVLHENKGHAGTPQFLSFSANGEWLLASASRGGNLPALILMETSELKTHHNFEAIMSDGFLTPDGTKIIGLGGDGEMRIFDVTARQRLYKGDPIRKYRFFKAERMALSPDGSTALITGDLGTGFGFYVLLVENLK